MNKSENNQGWVKLHRKLLDNCLIEKPDYLAVWIYLLLSANHKENTFIWNNKKQVLKAGQLITGRKALAKKTRLSQSKVYRILEYLEIEQQIEQQKTTKFTIITIVNWDRYQQDEQQSEQQVNNKRTTSEQQVNTNKNVKNVKNVKNDNKQRGDELYETFINGFNKVTGKKFKGSDTVKASLNARLQEGFTMKQIGMAILRASKSKYLCGENEDGKWYLTPEYILRRNKLDEWTNQSDKKEERRSI